LLVCCICNGCELPFGVIKNNNNNKEKEEDKCVFQPIAVESLGPLNETACQFLKDLGRRIPAQSERERECLPVPKEQEGTLSDGTEGTLNRWSLLSFNDSMLSSCSTTVLRRHTTWANGHSSVYIF